MSDQPTEVPTVEETEGKDARTILAEAAPSTEGTDVTETVTVEPPLLDEEQFNRLLASRGTDRLKMQRELGVVNPIEFAKLLRVRPQMIYNYIRSGKIKAAKHNNTQKLYIEAAEADRFAREYLGRKAARAAEVQKELQAS
jgi:hypothetical protein